jgi:glycosyltransferase involved in cell wall biosynthesis
VSEDSVSFDGEPCVSVVIPVYNEEESVGTVIERVLSLPMVLEVIVIDDGSTDRTPDVVRAIVDARVRYVRQPVNQGKTAAIARGLGEVKGEVLIIQDADLEYDPSEIPHVVEPILTGRADVVYGSRFLVRRTARVIYYYHYLANQLLTSLSNLFTNLNMTDMETGYKAFRTSIIKALPLTSRGFGLEVEITASLAGLPLRIYEVPISYYGRTYDEGKKIGLRDGAAALWYILYFNTVDRMTAKRRTFREHVAGELAKERAQKRTR